MVALSTCTHGCKVRVVSLCDDKRCRCRLCSLGLTPGVEVEVCEAGGSCRLRVRGGEICLGEDLARGVIVTPV